MPATRALPRAAPLVVFSRTTPPKKTKETTLGRSKTMKQMLSGVSQGGCGTKNLGQFAQIHGACDPGGWSCLTRKEGRC